MADERISSQLGVGGCKPCRGIFLCETETVSGDAAVRKYVPPRFGRMRMRKKHRHVTADAE